MTSLSSDLEHYKTIKRELQNFKDKFEHLCPTTLDQLNNDIDDYAQKIKQLSDKLNLQNDFQ